MLQCLLYNVSTIIQKVPLFFFICLFHCEDLSIQGNFSLSLSLSLSHYHCFSRIRTVKSVSACVSVGEGESRKERESQCYSWLVGEVLAPWRMGKVLLASLEPRHSIMLSSRNTHRHPNLFSSLKRTLHLLIFIPLRPNHNHYVLNLSLTLNKTQGFTRKCNTLCEHHLQHE